MTVDVSSDGIEIPDGLADYMKRVLEGEGLGHCRVVVWTCKGEGEYDDGKRDGVASVIRIGLCPTEERTKALFLDEVAHAVLDENDVPFADSYWHREPWQQEFKRLQERWP